MPDTNGFLEKAAEKCGFTRARYNYESVPTDVRKITVFPFFGDLRSTFVLSTLLLKRFREEDKSLRYFILASWPGMSGLFPFVDEYWEVQDKSLFKDACQFRNKKAAPFYRSLNEYFFEDMVTEEDFRGYYQNGIKDDFWTHYKQIVRYLPNVVSNSEKSGRKVFIFPSMHLQTWRQGDLAPIFASKDFWVNLVKRLLTDNFVPVVYKSWMTYDLSGELTGKCIFVDEPDILKVLSIMRATGCVLDLFSGISRLALAARCPFLMLDERVRYASLKEYEIDDICGNVLPKQYIFSFPTIIESGTIETWNDNIFQGIVAKLNEFLPTLDSDKLPSTGESFEQVSYENIRKIKMKRLGTRLLKVSSE